VAHFWGVTGGGNKTGETEPGIMQFYSLLYLAQAMGKQAITGTVRIAVITDNMQAVTGEEELDPGKAVVLGPVKVIPREYHFIDCCSIDIVPPPRGSAQEEQLPEWLAAELTTPSPGQITAYRGKHRWVQTFEPANLEEPPGDSLRLKQGGVYLVTGGLGGIGLVLAEYLAKSVGARLVLTGRSEFPPGNRWQSWLDTHPPHHPVSGKIQKLRELENLGAQLLVTSANVADEEQMQAVIAQARQRFGKINGVIHAAGIPDGAIIQQRTRETIDAVLAPKVKGTLVLNRLLDGEEEGPDFLVLCSSLSSILAPVGQVAYCAANAFLDAFSQYRNSRDNGKKNRGTIVASINWDTWREVGMAVAAAQRQPEGARTTIDYESALKTGLTPAEGIEVFKRILAAGWGSTAVCTRDLHLLLEAHRTPGKNHGEQETPANSTSIPTQNRPELSTPYVAPRDKTEQKLAETWRNFLVLDKVGIHDNFFELGASSLDIVQVNRKLENLFNRQIPVATLFTYPTVDTLKKYLDREEGTTAFSSEEAQRLEKISSKQKNKLKQRKKSVIGEEL
jgi:NAD(P)-dependent dehydrogenase (short-subunit alcohol dehydrogenase family)/acyl carrier protein